MIKLRDLNESIISLDKVRHVEFNEYSKSIYLTYEDVNRPITLSYNPEGLVSPFFNSDKALLISLLTGEKDD